MVHFTDTDNDHACMIMECTPFSCTYSQTATPRSSLWATRRRLLSTPRGTFEPMKKSPMTTSFPSRMRRYPVCVGRPTVEGHSTDVCTLTCARCHHHFYCAKFTFTIYIYSCILTVCLCLSNCFTFFFTTNHPSCTFGSRQSTSHKHIRM